MLPMSPGLQLFFKMWSCTWVTFLRFQASPSQLGDISEKFSKWWHLRIYPTDQRMMWIERQLGESDKWILKWLHLCMMSPPAPGGSISTILSQVWLATAFCLSSNSDFFPPCIASNTRQFSEGSWDWRYFWILDYFSHPLPGKSSGKTGSKNL